MKIQICDTLKERDWGSLTLWPYAEARKLEKFPDDVETLEHGLERGRMFINEMFRAFNGRKILAVGHGFINRCILSVVYGLDKSRIARMENAECRVVEINKEISEKMINVSYSDEASAN